MGLGGISGWQLLIILLIVVLIFGTKKLRGMGTDLGGAVKSFRKAMDDGDKDSQTPRLTEGEDRDGSTVGSGEKTDSKV